MKLYIAILALSLLACKKKSEDNPAPATNEPIIINTPTGQTCTLGVWDVQKQGEDTVEIKNGYLRLFSKHEVLNKFTTVKPSCATFAGDFEIRIEIPYLSLSDSALGGHFSANLSIPSMKSCSALLTTTIFGIAGQGSSSAVKSVTSKITNAHFIFKRSGKSLYVKLEHDSDSVENTYNDFGNEPLVLFFGAYSDSFAKMPTEAHIDKIEVISIASSFQTDEFTTGSILIK